MRGRAVRLAHRGDGDVVHAQVVGVRIPVLDVRVRDDDVRADTPEAVKSALARPEVASVIVPPEHRELLDLDLTELTYG